MPNTPAVLTVTDGQTGKPVAGATVNVSGGIAIVMGTTDASGSVTVLFPLIGTMKFKATKTDAIRSNQLTIVANF